MPTVTAKTQSNCSLHEGICAQSGSLHKVRSFRPDSQPRTFIVCSMSCYGEALPKDCIAQQDSGNDVARPDPGWLLGL